jgi:hypothetical protein
VTAPIFEHYGYECDIDRDNVSAWVSLHAPELAYIFTDVDSYSGSVIHAYVGDGKINIELDVEEFFVVEDKNDGLDLVLSALIGCDFKNDTPAYIIAEYFSDQTTKLLFDNLLDNKPLTRSSGYNCVIDGNDLKGWVTTHKPELLKLFE